MQQPVAAMPIRSTMPLPKQHCVLYRLCFPCPVTSYETLKGVRPVDQLRAVLPPDVYGRLAGAAAERKEQLAGGRRLGRVVEAQAVAAAEAEARDVPSVAGERRAHMGGFS